MKFKEINELTNEELVNQRREFKQEMIHLRVQQQSGQLENSARIRIVRRSIARIETVLKRRQQDGATKAAAPATAEA